MRSYALGVIALIAFVSLTACGATADSIANEADVKKLCEASGGRAYYVGFASEILRCDLSTLSSEQVK